MSEGTYDCPICGLGVPHAHGTANAALMDTDKLLRALSGEGLFFNLGVAGNGWVASLRRMPGPKDGRDAMIDPARFDKEFVSGKQATANLALRELARQVDAENMKHVSSESRGPKE